jgi:hypothetical protein
MPACFPHSVARTTHLIAAAAAAAAAVLVVVVVITTGVAIVPLDQYLIHFVTKVITRQDELPTLCVDNRSLSNLWFRIRVRAHSPQCVHRH